MLRFAYSTINWGDTCDLPTAFAEICQAGWKATELFAHSLDWLGTPTHLKATLNGLIPATFFASVDLPDSDRQRTLRLSGEEPTGKAGRDAWASVDDLVLRKIAQAGFAGLTSMVNGAPDTTPPASPAPGKTGPAVAEAEPAPLPGNDGITALGYTDH